MKAVIEMVDLGKLNQISVTKEKAIETKIHSFGYFY